MVTQQLGNAAGLPPLVTLISVAFADRLSAGSDLTEGQSELTDALPGVR